MNKKIALFVGDDVIGLQIVNSLIPMLQDDGFDPILYNTGTAPNRKTKAPPLEDYKFYDSGLLEKVIFPFIDNNDSHGKALTYKQLTKSKGVPHFKIDDVNNHTFEQEVEGAICIRFKQIFDCKTIKNIKDNSKFFWNLHGGLLPEYRGALVAAWAKINKEPEQGWTLHEIADDGTIDSGDIICETRFKTLNDNPVIHSSYPYLIPPSVSMIHQSILDHEQITPIPMSTERDNNYYSFPSEKLIKESGLTYCTPQVGLNYYLSLFANDENRSELTARLTREINKYEMSKTIPPVTPPLPSLKTAPS